MSIVKRMNMSSKRGKINKILKLTVQHLFLNYIKLLKLHQKEGICRFENGFKDRASIEFSRLSGFSGADRWKWTSDLDFVVQNTLMKNMR